MKSQRIAIIAFFHPEASLCLAKYIAKQNVNIDFYYITDIIKDKGAVAGFEYYNASRKPGIVRLKEQDIPEIYNDTKTYPIRYYLIRLLSFSNKILFLNKIILYYSLSKIKKQKYNTINIIGQHPWVEFIHSQLKGENIVHTFHEVGSHQTEKYSTPLITRIIKDKSKTILPSRITYQRFNSIEGADHMLNTYIPIGKLETLLLYRKKVDLKLHLDMKKTTFLFYGFIVPYKGLDLLKEAIENLQNYETEYNLIIAGGGYDPTISFFESKKNCQVINRFLTNEEMMHLNEIASAIVMPYKSASQSGIILTSFMLGRPIIATKVGALAETIVDHYNGLLVEPNNPIFFSNAMRMLINDKTLLEKLHIGAKNFGQNDEYDWNKIALKTLDFYKQ